MVKIKIILMSSYYQRRSVNLVKDLKGTRPHLRQSLLQEEEIVNLNKIYQARKDYYQIKHRQVELKMKQHVSNPQQGLTQNMTPFQKLNLYRKSRQDEQMKEKVRVLLNNRNLGKQKVKSKPPMIYKLLEEFKGKNKVQMPPKFFSQLKLSQQNLDNIRINSRRKKYITHQINASRVSRNKIISLETSLPQNPQFIYPSLIQILKGKSTNIVKKKTMFDFEDFEKMINELYPQQNKQQKQILYEGSRINNRKTKFKCSKNAQNSLNKSFKSSKNIISQMAGFYQTKIIKKRQGDQILDILKHDRPITSTIRRKNYQIIGSEHLNQVRVYRNLSQNQRKLILKKNYNFYMSLINMLTNYYQQDLNATIIICNKIKQILQSQYSLNHKIITQIVDQISSSQYDQMTKPILDSIYNFINESQKILTQ